MLRLPIFKSLGRLCTKLWEMLEAYAGYVLPKGKRKKRIHGGRTYEDVIIRTAVEEHY